MTLLSNARWNTISQFFKIMAQVVNLVYLAKIIPPEQYGLMALALVVFNFGVLLRDLGTAAVIIQKDIVTHKLINSIFWFNLFMGLLLAVIMCSTSPLISSLYEQPELILILMLLSLTFPLSSCASAHLALLERDSKFKIIARIEILSSLLSLIIAVLLANLGFGVYSLVAQAISLNFLSALQIWSASSWRPTFKSMIDLNEVKSVIGFSANLSGFNFINYFSRNADSFIIGKFMSVSILGSYNLAYRIMLFPLQSLTFVTTRSLYPILSRNQNDNEIISDKYFKCVFIILLITSPLMTGLAFYSKPFISLIFGESWALTSSILTWLAPTAIIQAVLSTSGAVFMAKGRTDILMKLGVLGAMLQVGSFIIGAQFSIVFFSMCYLIANIINFFPVMLVLMRLIDSSILVLLKKMAPIAISTLGMLLFMHGLEYFNCFKVVSSILKLLLLIFLSASVYSILMFTSSHSFRCVLFSFFRGGLKL